MKPDIRKVLDPWLKNPNSMAAVLLLVHYTQGQNPQAADCIAIAAVTPSQHILFWGVPYYTNSIMGPKTLL